MQIQSDYTKSAEEEFEEFKRANRVKEAKATAIKIELDCLTELCDKAYLKDMCRRANMQEIGAVVVYPVFVKACVGFLGDDPKASLIAAISYPHGGDTTDIKVDAVRRAVKDGVDEVEVSAPTALIKDGNFQYFKRECKKLKRAAKIRALRVVFDCGVLSENELVKACLVAADAGANCVRLNGADSELVSTVKAKLKGKCLIKADGAQEISSFISYCNVGADVVNCPRAFDLAAYLIKTAEDGN
ncbi:MAG: hypothetical protein ACI4MC_01840 [Candidatus Coproplasma sp.]